MVKMHADEVDIDVPLVRDLLAQFPEWADLPIEPVWPSGTDNAIYRLGEDLSVRLPRRERTTVPPGGWPARSSADTWSGRRGPRRSTSRQSSPR